MAAAADEPIKLRPVRRVAVVGGTHGNESTGVYVLRRFRAHPELLARDGLDVEYVLANPRSCREVRRFCDDDLNRQYSAVMLAREDPVSYEAARAKVLEQRLGPVDSDEPHTDFLIDMHTTTSRMGVTIIFESDGVDALSLFVAASVQAALHGSVEAPVFILFANMPRETVPHTPVLGRSGVAVEVGPIAQGLLRDDVTRWTEAAVTAIVDALVQFNATAASVTPTAPQHGLMVVQNTRRKIPCPSGSDDDDDDDTTAALPTAVFHEKLQSADYRPLRTGDPMFRSSDGTVLPYEGEHGDVIVPVFVNEAAYYLPESGLGFAVGKLLSVDLPPLLAADSDAGGACRASIAVPEPLSDAQTVEVLEAADPWVEAAAACK